MNIRQLKLNLKTWISKIGNQVFVFVLFFILVLSVFSIQVVTQNRIVEEKSRNVAEFMFPITVAAGNINTDINRQAFSIRGNVIRRDTAYTHERVVRYQQQVLPDLNFLMQMKPRFTNEKSRQRLDSLEKYIHLYLEKEEELNLWMLKNYVVARSDSGWYEQIIQLEESEMIPMTKKLSSTQGRIRIFLEPLLKENMEMLSSEVSLVNQKLNITSWITSLISLISIVIGSISGFFMIRKLKDSIQKPKILMERLAEGETSEDAELTSDEMKELIAASNKLNGNLKKASSFAQSIGVGNYAYQFEPVSSDDQLGNALVTMRNQLKTIAETDRKRNWAAEGLAKFAELMRLDHDFRNLANAMISELVKYLEANQGGIFILNDDDQAHPFLEMTGCYAYERIKHVKKRFEFGQGLIGQCYLEKETIYLLEVPKDYVSITSGLGDATPQCLLIVPLRLNDDVEGVIELATFKPFEKNEVEFVEKVGEIMASSISNAKVNYRTRMLLEESQQRTEELRAQEEEMRQNMEELQATQEDLQRKNEEFISMQNRLQMEQSMFLTLMDFITDRITYKDTESRILRVNKAKASRMKMQAGDLIGKSDYDFFTTDHADKAFSEEQEILRNGNPVLDQEEKLVYQDGSVSYASTSRVPFRDESNRIAGMFIITRDVTNLKLAEDTISEKNELVSAIQENFKFILFEIDEQHILKIRKPGGLEQLGLNPEIIGDKTFYQLYNLDPDQMTVPGSFTAAGVNFQLVRRNLKGEIAGFAFRK